MPVADDIIRRARAEDRNAIEALLADSYPAVHRIAHALTGNANTARRVVLAVLRRAVRVMPRWRRGITPENWFYHHALLLAREFPQPPAPASDLLAIAGPVEQPAYAAFIRALRDLPRQQMEAFILNHGEKLNVRLLGVAMDCSSGAASTHLDAAVHALRGISSELFPALTAALERSYATLTPPPTVIRATVSRAAGAELWSIRLRRLLRRLIALAIMVIVAYAAWHWREPLLQLIQAARSKAQSQST